ASRSSCFGWVVRPLEPPSSGTPSEDLFNPVNSPVRTGFADTDADDTVQECVCLGRGLESRQRTKVVAGGIDGLSTAESGVDIGSCMTQPLKRHGDQGMIVRLECDAQVQLHDTVRAQQQPVTSSRQDLAAKPRAFEIASCHGNDAANAMRYRSDSLRWRGCEPHGHQWLRFHGDLSPVRLWKGVSG